MAAPTYAELLEGATTWHKDHCGVGVILSHHGHRTGTEYVGAEPHPGTWCYYLLIPEQMYPHRWADFAVTRNERGYCDHGPAFEHEMFDTEITWQSSEPYWCRKTKRMWDAAKVGCDYNHSWHRDYGYPDTYQSVERDARRTVELFLAANPDHYVRCEYSGIWGMPNEFYTAVNGRRVHNSYADRFDNGWAKRRPTEIDALAARLDELMLELQPNSRGRVL